MRENMRTILVGCIVGLLVWAVIIAVPLYLLFRPAPVYETNDIADYGVVKGNCDNDTPKEFISSFFPKKIESYFSDVTYHYKAKELDTYAYEMQLEFVIKDTDKYTAFLSDVIGDAVCEPFYFAPDFQAHYISDELELGECREDYRFYISGAKIGLVLFSEEERRFVFVALGMYDGGGANVEELGFFFDRFGIDPEEYARRAEHGYIIPDVS